MNLFTLTVAILLANSQLFHSDDVYVSSGKIRFYANKAVFYSGTVSRVDIYYLLDGNSIGDTGYVDYTLKLRLDDVSGKKQAVERELPIRAYVTKTNPFVIDMFALYLEPGTYNLKFELSFPGKKKGTLLMPINVPSMPDTLSISDIELIWATGEDTGSVFSRYGLKLVPNPIDAYFPGHDTLIYLFEVYNLVPDTGKYVVMAVVEDENGRILRSTRPTLKEKHGDSLSVVVGGISLGEIIPGRYHLKVQVTDLSNSRQVTGTKEFVYSYGAGVEPDSEILEYAGFIEYFASPEEMDQYENLPDDGKVLFLKRFWHQRGYTLKEIMERVKYADEHFSVGRKKGRFTDRGRIYIKYGPPDEVEKSGVAMSDLEKETWFYYKGRGLEFVFVDIDGTGDYKLVYSNAPGEPSMPNWREYLSPQDIQGGEW